jgi:hypothetical protein
MPFILRADEVKELEDIEKWNFIPKSQEQNILQEAQWSPGGFD